MAMTPGDRRTLTGEAIVTRARALSGWAMADWLPNPDPVLKALGRDIEVYRDLRSDAHVGGCIRRRKAAVLALESRLSRCAAPARAAKAIEEWLKDLPLTVILSELLDAALYGYQPAEINWGKVGTLLLPEEVVAKPPEWFGFDNDNRLRFRARDSGVAGELLPKRKFLCARQEPSYDNPYGQPDLAMVFWPSTFKKGGLKFWVSFTERYGSPFLIGKQPRSVQPAESEALADRLEAMIQDAVAVVPDDASVEIIEAAGKANSAEVYRELLIFCRSEVSIALLGQNQTTEASATHASAMAGLEVARAIRDGDAAMLSSAIQQLIDWVVELNWPGAASPRWSLSEQDEIDEVRPRRDKILVDCGVRFSRKYWIETYGLSEGHVEENLAAPTDARLRATGPAPAGAAADLAAPVAIAAQAQIDTAADADPGYQAAMDAMLAPILEAFDAGLTPEEILARMDEWYGQMDDAALFALLERGIAAADAIGRLEVAREAPAGQAGS